MTNIRPILAVAASIVALGYGSAAFAQAADPAPTPAAEPEAQADTSDIVVTGTRAVGRSRLDSSSPVDVLSGNSLRNQGTTEIASALAAVAPSIDFPRSAAVDGTDSIRPATLRGLSPDQTLVLINGVRAHTSALLNVNGSVGRGAAAVDLNTIPSVALDRIEVLRDGASAQYGSDAIAGVVNLRLREARSGGGATFSWGEYVTDVDTARGSRKERDGKTGTFSAWQGIPLGDDGFLTVSGEFLDRNPTSRGDYDPRKTPIRVRSRFGDPDVDQYTLFLNAAKPLGGSGWTLYGFGGYQLRDSTSAATPRIAGGTGSNANASADALASIYPDGFTPLIYIQSDDLTATGGLRGEVSGWKVDFNVSYGRNQLSFFTKNSGNATYGASSLTSFYDGKLTYDQLVSGVDVAKELPLGAGTINVAFGGEYRREGFKIGAGIPESYDRAPGSSSSLGSGAQGFPGFQPSNVINRHRSNWSGYIDLEAKPVTGLTLGAAVRGESYSDFGEVATFKGSARFDFAPWFAVRGTASTGFRAPSLQQQYFTSTSSVLNTGGAIVETGTFPATSLVGTALGGKPLRPEKSRNLSAGVVLRGGGFDLSVDAYQIKLRDQIALSENLADPSGSTVITTLLAPYNVSAGRYFLNGVRSTTKGIDVVAHYRAPTSSAGTFDLTLAGNFNDIKVTRVPGSATITSSAGSVTLPIFTRQRIVSLEQGTPREKVVGTIDWSLGPVGLTARGSYYGDVTQPSSGNGLPGNDIHTGRHTLFDLEARFQVQRNLNLALGANNIFDVYPDYVKTNSPTTGTALNSTGLVGFPYYSPFGYNGRFLYGRIGVTW